MPSFAAASFQHRFPIAEFGTHRRKPAQQFIAILLILMRKLLPGPTKVFGRCLLSGAHLCQISEARNSTTNGKGPETPRTRQLAGDNFNPIFFLNRFQMNRRFT